MNLSPDYHVKITQRTHAEIIRLFRSCRGKPQIWGVWAGAAYMPKPAHTPQIWDLSRQIPMSHFFQGSGAGELAAQPKGKGSRRPIQTESTGFRLESPYHGKSPRNFHTENASDALIYLKGAFVRAIALGSACTGTRSTPAGFVQAYTQGVRLLPLLTTSRVNAPTVATAVGAARGEVFLRIQAHCPYGSIHAHAHGFHFTCHAPALSR
jgi:hypothetical protein